jgi:hypothetical protein
MICKGAACWRQARFVVFLDDAQKDHPSGEFASAHQRPSAIHAVSTRDNLSLSGGARTVRGNDIRVRVHSPCCLRRELSGSLMRIAIPHAPSDRGIRPRQLLENLHCFHRREIEPGVRLMIWIKAFRFLDQDNGSVPVRRNEPPTPQMRDGA